LKVRRNNNGIRHQGKQGDAFAGDMDLAVGADSPFRKYSDASVVGEFSHRLTDACNVIPGSVNGNHAENTEQLMENPDIVVLARLHESDEAMLAGDLQTNRVVSRRVVCDQDEWTAIRNIFDAADVKLFEDLEV
jgi:hypothetical protein